MHLYPDKWRKSASVLLPAAHECFGEWLTPSFQQMFYGACRVSVLHCQGALSFCIFHKCEYEASPKERKKKNNLKCFHSMLSLEDTSFRLALSWRRSLRCLSVKTFSKPHFLIYESPPPSLHPHHHPCFPPWVTKHADNNISLNTGCGHPLQIFCVPVRIPKPCSEASHRCSCFWVWCTW